MLPDTVAAAGTSRTFVQGNRPVAAARVVLKGIADRSTGVCESTADLALGFGNPLFCAGPVIHGVVAS